MRSSSSCAPPHSHPPLTGVYLVSIGHSSLCSQFSISLGFVMPPPSLSYLLSPYRSRFSSMGYGPLPSASDSHQKTLHGFRRIYHVLTSRRRLRVALVVVGLLVAGCVAAATYVFNYPLPPLYRRFHEAELKLPQHDAWLPLPEGRHGRYLWVANHASSESV